MRITIDRDERDVLHAACMLDLSDMEEVVACIRDGAYDEARALRDRILSTTLLLDHLGWDPAAGEGPYVVQADPDWLREVVGRLREQADECLRDHAEWIRRESTASTVRADDEQRWLSDVRHSVDEDLDTRLVCDRVIARVDGVAGPTA